MHIPKCQGVFNRIVFNLLFDLIYFLFNKVLETWKNCETPCTTKYNACLWQEDEYRPKQ